MAEINIEEKRKKLNMFYDQMRPSVLKNIRRNKNLEALYYYHLILRYATKFLRIKYGWPKKTDFDLKHIYRDIPNNETEKLEKFYDVRISEIKDNMLDLERWIKNLWYLMNEQASPLYNTATLAFLAIQLACACFVS